MFVILALNLHKGHLVFFFFQEIYETDAKAWDGIRKSRAWGLLHFKRNYTNSLISRFNMPLELDEETILGGFVETRLDSSSNFYFHSALLIFNARA